MKKDKYLYRYEVFFIFDTPVLDLQEYLVIKETPCGTRYLVGSKKTKWTSKTGNNPHAHKTKEEALHAFVRRKMYRNGYIQEELERNMSFIRKAKKMIENGQKK